MLTLPQLQVRKTIWDILERACRDDGKSYEQLSNIEGITLLEDKTVPDYKNRCTRFAFETIKGEDWVPKRDGSEEIKLSFEKDLFDVTERFLKLKEYTRVEEPQTGDITVYGYKRDHTSFVAQHFGIYVRGKVMSKFGPGPICLHDIELVPERWGNNVLFFRKDE